MKWFIILPVLIVGLVLIGLECAVKMVDIFCKAILPKLARKIRWAEDCMVR